MEQERYESLSGTTLDESQSSRFETVNDVAVAELEKILGYPLDPTTWENLYNETGKTEDECPCPDVDTDNLQDPDPVVGKYRLYDYYPTDKYLAIDPATAIHNVKLVKDDVTFKTYEEDDYRVNWKSGKPKVAKYLELCWKDHCLCACVRRCDCVQVAVDATWAYTALPLELEQILAEMIFVGYEDWNRKGIKSESRGTHSYTKLDKQDWLTKFPILASYAGPNGTATRPRLV